MENLGKPTAQSTTYHLPPTTYHLPPTTYHLPTADKLPPLFAGSFFDTREQGRARGTGGTGETGETESPVFLVFLVFPLGRPRPLTVDGRQKKGCAFN